MIKSRTIRQADGRERLEIVEADPLIAIALEYEFGTSVLAWLNEEGEMVPTPACPAKLRANIDVINGEYRQEREAALHANRDEKG